MTAEGTLLKKILKKRPNYNSKKFRKGIEKTKKESEKLKELSKVDGDRLNIRFDIQLNLKIIDMEWILIGILFVWCIIQQVQIHNLKDDCGTLNSRTWMFQKFGT